MRMAKIGWEKDLSIEWEDELLKQRLGGLMRDLRKTLCNAMHMLRLFVPYE